MKGCLKWVIILALLPAAIGTALWLIFGGFVFLGLMLS